MISHIQSAVSGFSYPFRGVKMMATRPTLWPFVAIPIAINTFVYGIGFWFITSRFGQWLNALINRGEEWYWAFLFYLLVIVLGGMLLVVAGYTFTIVGNLMLSPFNDLISERVERMHTGVSDDAPFNLSRVIAGAVRAFATAARRLGLYLLGFLSLLLLLLIPGAGIPLYGVAVTIYSMFFLAWEFFDYPMDRHFFDYGMKKSTAFGNLATFLGFGAGTWLLIIIPFLGLLMIPACVIGATLLFCELRQRSLLPLSPIEAAKPVGPVTPVKAGQ